MGFTKQNPDNMHTSVQRWIYVSLFVGTMYSFFGGPTPFYTTAHVGSTNWSHVGSTNWPYVGLTKRPNVGLTNWPYVGSTNWPYVGSTNWPQVGSTNWPYVGLTKRPNVGLTKRPHVGLIKWPNVGSTKWPHVRITWLLVRRHHVVISLQNNTNTSLILCSQSEIRRKKFIFKLNSNEKLNNSDGNKYATQRLSC